MRGSAVVEEDELLELPFQALEVPQKDLAVHLRVLAEHLATVHGQGPEDEGLLVGTGDEHPGLAPLERPDRPDDAVVDEDGLVLDDYSPVLLKRVQ